MQDSNKIWNLKTKQFPRFVKDAPDTLEILEFLRASGACFEGKSLIDIGCGNGRFALQLAPQVREIVGFDTSDVMLSALLEDATRLGLGNVKTLQGDWQDFIPPKTFDIAFASMTPALNTKSGFVKALRVCEEGLCYVGWGRVRKSEFLQEILALHNLTLALPTGLPNVLEWLSELGREVPKFCYKRSDFMYESPIGKVIDDVIFHITIHEGEPNMNLIKEYVSARACEGIIRYPQEREIGIAYIPK